MKNTTNTTNTTANATVNQEAAQIQKGNLTFAQAKKKFVGMSIVRLEDAVTYSADGEDCEYCEEATCAGCPLRQEHRHTIEIGIDDAHSTRRSFLLECEALRTSFVVPKERAAEFKFEAGTVSENVWEQLCNLGMNLDEAKFMYCRAWKQGTRRQRYGERQFVYSCKKSYATCLAFVTPGAMWKFDDSAKKRLGALAHEFVASHCDEDCIEQASEGMECWLFQYDAEDDVLVLPADDGEMQIDRMIELLEQEMAKSASN